MATLVLTAVGGVVGGPVGAAIGGLLGQQVDRATLFAPPLRHGPRLTELAVQTSSYGTPIPRLFGTIRVAGSVIWSTDLIETATEDEGGKGAPDSVRYRYSVSFAVLVSGRPIRAIRRIWADGKLLRGAAGDLKSPVTLRIHRGGEDQVPDPLIVAAMGADAVPAHRGHAYAVFEAMELADYANRIPSLTFEVEADAGPVAIGRIAEEVGGGAVTAEPGLMTLDGLAAQGGSQRAVLDMLAQAGGGWFAQGVNGDVRLCQGPGPVATIADLGVGRDARRGVRRIAPVDTAPRRVSVRHHDAARDYQAGMQQARRAGAGWREETIDLPAVVTPGQAHAIARRRIAAADAERTRRTVWPGEEGWRLSPGERVAVAGEAGLWRIRQLAIEGGAPRVELTPVGDAEATGSSAAPVPTGAFPGAADVVHGATRIAAFELPPDDTVAAQPRIGIAAAGDSAGWRRAAVMLTRDGGVRWEAVGGTRAPATMGRVVVPPGPASAMIVDRIHDVEVALAHAGMALGDADAAAIDDGANLVLVGDEWLQFERAQPLGSGHWRLSGLWRGRRGTGPAMSAHETGEQFVLIEPQRLLVVPVDGGVPGTVIEVAARGIGDERPAEADTVLAGSAMLPMPPVHVRLDRSGTGDAVLRWTRQSRAGWRWRDEVDAPLGEERERYRVEIREADGSLVAEWEGDRPEWTVPDAQIAPGRTVSVRQVGTHGVSPPTTRSLERTEGTA